MEYNLTDGTEPINNSNENDTDSYISDFNDNYLTDVTFTSVELPLNINHNLNNNDHIENECNLCNMCNMCSICSELFTDDLNNSIVKTKCNHVYHETCILEWFNEDQDKSCPLCRTKFEIREYINIKQLKNDKTIIDSKSIELTYSMSNHMCDFCDNTIKNNMYHLRGKNYDLCVECYGKMLDAYNNKIDYKTIKINEHSVIDKHFSPEKYDYCEQNTYDLDKDYDNLTLYNPNINKNITCKNTLKLSNCTINENVLELKSKTIDMENCEMISKTCNIDANELSIIYSYISDDSNIYQGNENMETFEICFSYPFDENKLFISQKVNDINFLKLKSVDLSQENTIVKILDGKYDFGPVVERINISDVKFKNLPKFGNQVIELALENATCETISELDFDNFHQLKKLTLRDMYINKIVNFGNSIKEIRIENCNINDFPKRLPQQLISIKLDGKIKSTEFDSEIFNIPTLTELDIDRINIKSIMLPDNIIDVSITNCSLESVLNEKLPNSIYSIKIINCKLKHIGEINSGIYILNLSNNYLKHISTIPSTADDINISNNYLTEINISPETCKIKTIDLSNNKLKIINCNFNDTTIHELYLQNNRLKSLTLNNVNIYKFKINNNKLTNFSYTGKIIIFNCRNNKLTELKIDQTEYLNCSYNNLSNIDNLNNLFSLNCSHNKNLGDTININGNTLNTLNIVDTNIKYILTGLKTKKLNSFKYNEKTLITGVTKNKYNFLIDTIDVTATKEKKLIKHNIRQNNTPKTIDVLTENTDDDFFSSLFC
jgi:hypothetical protein